jgi:hypothetical protein
MQQDEPIRGFTYTPANIQTLILAAVDLGYANHCLRQVYASQPTPELAALLRHIEICHDHLHALDPHIVEAEE